MEQSNFRLREPFQMPMPGSRVSLLVAGCAMVMFLAAICAIKLQELELSLALFAVILTALVIVFFLHAHFLHLAHRQQRRTTAALDSTEREFQSIFENALDTILILDTQGTVRDANPAAQQSFGVTLPELIGQSLGNFYKSRKEFEISWKHLLDHKHNHCYAELRRRDRSALFVEFTAKADYLQGRHLMIVRDVTLRRHAEEEVGKNLALARTAWSEADALRKATLALTQDLRMDYVLDTLFSSLRQLVPYESAQVWLVEADSKLLLAREALPERTTKEFLNSPMTLEGADYPIIRRVLTTLSEVLLADTAGEAEWLPVEGNTAIRSWIAVPLSASQQMLGILSLAHTVPMTFTREHLRLAKSLAVSAAVAIQNARLYERAEIYGEELERRLSELHKAKQALEQSEKRAASKSRPKYN